MNDSMPQNNLVFSHSAAVEDMAQKLSDKFVDSRDAVFGLKRVIEDTWESPIGMPEVQPCCEFRKEDHEYDNAFKDYVDKKTLCFNRADDDVDRIPIHEKVLGTMRENMDGNKALKWQHYGTQKGFHVSFPNTKTNDDCFNFDPRERPW